jgi:hypothetical protein
MFFRLTKRFDPQRVKQLQRLCINKINDLSSSMNNDFLLFK